MVAKAAASLTDNLFGLVHRNVDQYDLRYSPRKSAAEEQRLRSLTTTKNHNGIYAPNVKLSDFEGRDFVTSMSDRLDAGGEIVDVNGVPLNRPVGVYGGQDYMFNNEGRVWASALGPVNQIMKQAGPDSLFMPWRMAPTGGDFSTTTGEIMFSYAESSMTKAQKKALDEAISGYVTKGKMVKDKKTKVSERKGDGLSIKGWKGIDNPESVEVWRNTPDPIRKEIMDMMDKQFRDQGGLGIGEARLAVADPTQIGARDGGVQNVGRIFADQEILQHSDNPSYPYAVPGEGIGRLEDQPMTIFDLIPDARLGEKQRHVGTTVDPVNPTSNDLRALQMKPYTGTITPEILKKLQDRGIDVGNIDPALLATLGLTSAGAAGGSLLMGDGKNKVKKYVDSLFSEVME